MFLLGVLFAFGAFVAFAQRILTGAPMSIGELLGWLALIVVFPISGALAPRRGR